MIIKEVKIDTPKKRQRRKPSRFQQSPDKHLVKNAIRAARNEFFYCVIFGLLIFGGVFLALI